MLLVGEFCRHLCVFTIMVLIQACRTTYSRDTLLAINGQSRCAIDQHVRDVISHLHLHRRGCRAGHHQRRHVLAAHSVTSAVSQSGTAREIPNVIGNRGQSNVNTGQLFHGYRDARVRIRRTVARIGQHRSCQDVKLPRADETVPSLYVLNAAALSKPGAVEHLTTDLVNCGSDVAVEQKHILSLNTQTAPLQSTATQYSAEIVMVDEVAEWPSTLGLIYRQLFGSIHKTIVLLN